MAITTLKHDLVIANQLIKEGWYSTPFVAKTPRIREASNWCTQSFGAMYSDWIGIGDWYGLKPDEVTDTDVGVYFIFRHERDLMLFLLRWQ
jgi:hypothetical protein